MSSFPDVRLRRFRRTGALRGLVRETRLDLEAFVMPLFVAPESLRNEALPGMARFSVDDVVREVEDLVRGGVQAVMLFGVPEEKDEQATGAWEDDGIVQLALRALRPRFHDSVRRNLSWGAGAPDDATLWDALSLAGADALVRTLPEGLDTIVGERGSLLSAQRMCSWGPSGLPVSHTRQPRISICPD